MRDSIAAILNDLYEGYDFDPKGEDYGIAWSEPEIQRSERAAEYWAEINVARERSGALTWDGLLTEATYRANGETDPNLRVDALLRVAATAIAAAVSIGRQAEAINGEE